MRHFTVIADLNIIWKKSNMVDYLFSAYFVPVYVSFKIIKNCWWMSSFPVCQKPWTFMSNEQPWTYCDIGHSWATMNILWYWPFMNSHECTVILSIHEQPWMYHDLYHWSSTMNVLWSLPVLNDGIQMFIFHELHLAWTI